MKVFPGATHQIVQDYLRHYAYADTLHAFDQAAGLDQSSPSTSGRWEHQILYSCTQVLLFMLCAVPVFLN